MKSLAKMQAEVVANCKAKGWYEDERTFPEMIAMLHSEASEALEAWRMWGTADATEICRKLPPWADSYKPEGVGSEFADILIRLLDDCDRYGIDLEAEYERKMHFNRQRPHKHGGKPI